MSGDPEDVSHGDQGAACGQSLSDTLFEVVQGDGDDDVGRQAVDRPDRQRSEDAPAGGHQCVVVAAPW